jgi:hypothetical protein|nr:NUMOD3 domain-containing DNA-binding protein [Halolamina sediminis]
MQKRGVETRELAGENHPQYGSERDEATRVKISETMAGREFSAETIERFREAKQGSEIPAETREKISESLSGLERSDEIRERMSAARSGAQNPQWKGGVSDSYGVGWGKARECVRERDVVCQHCGREGNERRLDVHHVFRFGCSSRPTRPRPRRHTNSGTSFSSVARATGKPSEVR